MIEIKRNSSLALNEVQGYTTLDKVVHITLSPKYKLEEYEALDASVLSTIAHESMHVRQLFRKDKRYENGIKGKSFEDLCAVEFEAYLISALTISGKYYSGLDDYAKSPLLHEMVTKVEHKLKGVFPRLAPVDTKKVFTKQNYLSAIEHSIAYKFRKTHDVKNVAKFIHHQILTHIEDYPKGRTFTAQDSFKKTVDAFVNELVTYEWQK